MEVKVTNLIADPPSETTYRGSPDEVKAQLLKRYPWAGKDDAAQAPVQEIISRLAGAQALGVEWEE